MEDDYWNNQPQLSESAGSINQPQLSQAVGLLNQPHLEYGMDKFCAFFYSLYFVRR